MTPEITTLHREILSYKDHEIAWAVIETLRMEGAPMATCDWLQEQWCHRQRGRKIYAEAVAV